MPDEQTEGEQKTTTDLQKELDAATRNYEKLTAAHEKLKGDLVTLKASTSDAAELQKQIERHISDKSKLLREKEELQESFNDYRKEIQQKDLKVLLSTELEAAGARTASTALKLLDLDVIKFDDKGLVLPDSVTAAIDSLKISDPILFKDSAEAANTVQKSPSIKLAVDKITQSAYETEIQAAVKKGDQKLLEEVVAKYQVQRV